MDSLPGGSAHARLEEAYEHILLLLLVEEDTQMDQVSSFSILVLHFKDMGTWN